MAFPADVLVAGVLIADTLTKGVQSTCRWEPWNGADVYGTPTYAAARDLVAVVEYTNKQFTNTSGETITLVATLTVVGDLAPPLTHADRRNPIDTRDRITLPNGFSGPLVSAPDAVVNPGTSRGFIQQVQMSNR